MFPRRGAIALVTTAIALVLLFNFKTPNQLQSNDAIASTGGSATTRGSATSGSATSGSATSGSATSGSSKSSGSSAPSTTPTAGTGAASGTETLTGSIVTSRYGSTEVQVTISNGKITAVSALELPTGGRSGQISRYVEPFLASEALSAQSANIDIVSGATYTSEAYAQSLQSALDQASLSTQAAG